MTEIVPYVPEVDRYLNRAIKEDARLIMDLITSDDPLAVEKAGDIIREHIWLHLLLKGTGEQGAQMGGILK